MRRRTRKSAAVVCLSGQIRVSGRPEYGRSGAHVEAQKKVAVTSRLPYAPEARWPGQLLANAVTDASRLGFPLPIMAVGGTIEYPDRRCSPSLWTRSRRMITSRGPHLQTRQRSSILMTLTVSPAAGAIIRCRGQLAPFLARRLCSPRNADRCRIRPVQRAAFCPLPRKWQKFSKPTRLCVAGRMPLAWPVVD